LEQFEKILTALRADIRGIELKLPEPDDAVSMPRLKRYEDSLDALVCAWVGAKYVEGDAVPYGDLMIPPQGGHVVAVLERFLSGV